MNRAVAVFCVLGCFGFISLTLLLRVAHASAFIKPPNNLGLAGSWMFNEGAGTVAGDNSIYGQSGTLTGGPTWITGRRDKALHFAGDNDVVTVTDSAGVLNPSSFTISFWVKPTSFTESDIVEKGGAGGYVFWMAVSQGNKLLFGKEGGGASDFVTGVAMPSTSVWTHVVGTYDGSTLRMYYNGAEVGNKLSNHVISNAGTLNIGGGNDGFFNGDVDELRIYSRTLGPTEVATLYSQMSQTGISRLKGAALGLVGSYPFSEGTGTVSSNATGQGNDLTLTGTAWTTGKSGNALSFNGGDIAQVDSLFGSPSNVTVAAWARCTGIPGSGGELVSLANSVLIRFDSDVRGLYYTGSVYRQAVYGFSLCDSAWHHIAYTVDPANSSQILYIDGNSGSSSGFSDALAYDGTVPRLAIGHHADISNANYDWNGQIDDVRVYSRALTAAEIASIYSASGGASRNHVNSSRNYSQSTGLVGLWSFDGADMTSAVVYDRSGQGNNGAISGAVPALGKIGQALQFDGVDDDVVVSSTPALGPTQMSISFWAYLNDGTATHRLIDKTAGAYIVRTNSNHMQIVTNNGLDTFFNSSDNGSTATRTWQHWVITAGSSGGIWYRDGVQTNTTATAFSGVNISDPLEFAGTVDPFPGRLDEVRIYNRILSPVEVLQLYVMGR
jgi:hypothetical protein